MKKYNYLLLAAYCIIHSTISITLGFAIPLFAVFLIANIFLLGFQVWYLFIFDRYEEIETKIKAQDEKEREQLQNFLIDNKQ